MGAVTYTTYGEIAFETCCNCSVVFGMTKELYSQRRSDGKGFFCPNGHQQYYTDTEATRLKKELEKEQQRRRWAEERAEINGREAKTQEHRARAYKGKVTHIKRRVGNGVCPCCNRTFQNLMRHMKTKHPKFKEVDK